MMSRMDVVPTEQQPISTPGNKTNWSEISGQAKMRQSNLPFITEALKRVVHAPLTLQLSTTNTQSSMVMDVSAMLVDTTILRTPLGGTSKMAFCSTVERDP